MLKNGQSLRAAKKNQTRGSGAEGRDSVTSVPVKWLEVEEQGRVVRMVRVVVGPKMTLQSKKNPPVGS